MIHVLNKAIINHHHANLVLPNVASTLEILRYRAFGDGHAI